MIRRREDLTSAWRKEKWQGWGGAGSIKHALMMRKHEVFMRKGNYVGDKIVLNLSWNEMFCVGQFTTNFLLERN